MPSAFDLLAISVGGAAGSVIRYFLAIASIKFAGGSTLAGTLAANLIGCLAIGILSAVVLSHPQWLSSSIALALRVGLLGGLTTFSTFASEAVALGSAERPVAMASYLIVSVVLGILAVSLGMWIGTPKQVAI